MAGVVLIAAGGTGGHLFPAQALAVALTARGWRVHLATDRRVESFGQDFPAEKVHLIRSATLTREPLAAARAIAMMGFGVMQARRLVRELVPEVAVGFGGYPTIPPMLAAHWAGVPTVIHDQNAVLGRANRFLAGRVDRVALSVARVGGAEAFAGRTVVTGNPVRPAVIAAAATPYPRRAPGDPFRLLAFGGSQGARFLSDVVPAAVSLITDDVGRLLHIVQQCRPEDLERVRATYGQLNVAAELQPFFADMPARIAASHLIVSRSGASTCAELAVIGRPAVLIPLPGALDQDQKANAQVLAEAGGGWLMEQRDLSSARLAGEIMRFAREPERLETAAAAARTLGRPDAVDRLADLVEQVARERRERPAARAGQPTP